MTVEEQAGLHEATVQDAELHAARLAAARRKPRAKGGRNSRTRTKVQVDRRVMAAARELQAQRPGTKLRIVDAETVMVE